MHYMILMSEKMMSQKKFGEIKLVPYSKPLKYHTDCILLCSNASPIESPKRCPNTLTNPPQRDGYLSLFSHFVLQSANVYETLANVLWYATRLHS